MCQLLSVCPVLSWGQCDVVAPVAVVVSVVVVVAVVEVT